MPAEGMNASSRLRFQHTISWNQLLLSWRQGHSIKTQPKQQPMPSPPHTTLIGQSVLLHSHCPERSTLIDWSDRAFPTHWSENTTPVGHSTRLSLAGWLDHWPVSHLLGAGSNRRQQIPSSEQNTQLSSARMREFHWSECVTFIGQKRATLIGRFLTSSAPIRKRDSNPDPDASGTECVFWMWGRG